jgi:hypothetical protein
MCVQGVIDNIRSLPSELKAVLNMQAKCPQGMRRSKTPNQPRRPSPTTAGRITPGPHPFLLSSSLTSPSLSPMLRPAANPRASSTAINKAGLAPSLYKAREVPVRRCRRSRPPSYCLSRLVALKHCEGGEDWFRSVLARGGWRRASGLNVSLIA